MPYTTITDLEHAAGSRARLVQIADRDGDGMPDTPFITAAQAKADGLINSYAGKRYAVPIANPSQMLVQMAADETVYQMLLRSSTGPTEAERDEWERRESWLKDLSRGRVIPSDPQPQQSRTARNRYQRSTRAMSRARTKGFW